MNPFISICIPAYKNTAYLEVLLRSIASQSYRDFEVIVSDDSPDDSVKAVCTEFSSKFPLIYHKNPMVKGSPANWNVGIALAKGTWIKLMHDDDWFADEHSLEKFAKAAVDHPGAGFIFSGYSNYERGERKRILMPGPDVKRKLEKSPLCLFRKNYIGPPSTTMIKNNQKEWYDEQTKWVVDFEFYIRCLKSNAFLIINEPLVNIGVNEAQITKAVFGDRKVLIPENIYMLNKMGVSILKNITVFDHYWRLFRNFGIRSVEEAEKYSGNNKLPDEIKKMLRFQTKIPLGVLRMGVFSKMFMAMSFYRN